MRSYTPFTMDEVEELGRLIRHAHQSGPPGSKAFQNQALVRDHLERNAVVYIGRLVSTLQQMQTHDFHAGHPPALGDSFLQEKDR
jgi:hypothetical protein